MRRVVLVIFLIVCALASFAQVDHPNLERGFSPDRVYQLGELDQIDLFNGALKLTLPIGPRYPVNGNLSYGLTLIYNSQIWDLEPGTYMGFDEDAHGNTVWVEFPYVDAMPTGRSNAGMGWLLSLGKIFEGAPFNDESYLLYESPDGQGHDLGKPLKVGDVSYTRDGTYLRAKRTAETEITIEFPDGAIHTFSRLPKNDWRLVKMADRFGNEVSVEYPNDTDLWIIRDNHGREQKIYFAKAATYGWWGTAYKNRMVDRVVLSSFGDHPALEYKFIYETAKVKNTCDSWAQLYTPKEYRDQPFLKQIQLPDGSFFTFTYANSKGSPSNPQQCEQGALTKMNLPTGGAIQWDWKRYTLLTTDCYTHGYFLGQMPPGVATRTMFDENGLSGGRITKYSQTLPALKKPSDCPTKQAYEWVGTVVEAPDHTRTIHYFTLWPFVSKSTDGYSVHERNMPYRRLPDGRRLSTEFLGTCTGTNCPSLRSTYVKWEFESTTEFTERLRSFNRRQVLEDTVYPKDGDKNVHKFFTNFDGVGHFRSALYESTIPGSFSRQESTSWNATTGEMKVDDDGKITSDVVRPAPGDEWVLNTYSRQSATENGTTETSEYCFDKHTGFLTRKRTYKDGASLPNKKDVLVEYSTEDGHGNVTREDYYGGDLQDINDTANLVCDVTLPDGGPQRTILNGYEFGVRNLSKFKDAPFNILDLSIDQKAGLPASQTDIAGITTTFDYDSMLRLLWEKPQSGQGPWRQYLVTNASASSPATADVISYKNGSTTSELTHQQIIYDAFGRVLRDLLRLPGEEEQWSVRDVAYDAAGRKFSESSVELFDKNSPPADRTFYSYDPFGRVATIQAPDGSLTSYDYKDGVSQAVRTSQVATPGNDRTDVVVTEHYDAAGRLVNVEEAADGTNVDTPKGGNVLTTYKYDVGGRLISAQVGSQLRTFEYDGLGFLRKEHHPENGDTVYDDYDARGHAGKRTSGGTTVQSTYDAFERVRFLKEFPSDKLIKEFQYGADNAGSFPNIDYSKGKMTKAVRRNELTSAGTIDVTESYEYKGIGGQMSKRTTEIARVTKNADGSENHLPIQTFDYQVNYDDHALPSTLTMPTCPGCPTANGLATVTNVWSAGRLTGVQGFGSITYHPNGMVHTVQFETPQKPVDKYDVRFGMPRPSKITFAACGDVHPYFLPGVAIAKTNALECAFQVTWPSATACGGGSAIKYRVLRNNVDITNQSGSNCLSTPKFMDRTAVQGTPYTYRIIAEGPQVDGGKGICQGGYETELQDTLAGSRGSCNTDVTLALLPTTATAFVGIPQTYKALLSTPDGPVVDEDLTFVLNGKKISCADDHDTACVVKTGPDGTATAIGSLDLEPKAYELKVIYAGGVLPSRTTIGKINLFCGFPSYLVNPLFYNLRPEDRTYEVSVNTSDHCSWSPSADPGFITLPVPGSRTGSSQFDFRVSQNTTAESRTSNISVALKQVKVKQSGTGCSYGFDPEIAYVPAESNIGNVSMTISTGDNCPWRVESDSNWVRFVPPPGQNPRPANHDIGTRTIYFTVDPQEDPSKRVATLRLYNKESALDGGSVVASTKVNQNAPPIPVPPSGMDVNLQGGSVSNGSNVTLRVWVREGTQLQYRWFINDAPVYPYCKFCSSLTLHPGDNGYPGSSSSTFQVEVFNSRGKLASRKVTWSNNTPSATCRVPYIIDSLFHGEDTPGDSISPFPGFNVTLFVVGAHANGGDPSTLHYQWYRGISGDEDSPIAPDPPDPNTGFSYPDTIHVNPFFTSFYWVKVTDSCGSNYSRTAAVFSAPPPPGRRRACCSFDLNSDNKNDIPWHNSATGQNEVWLMNGTDHASTATLPLSDPKTQLQSAGDLDADGNLDLMFRNPETGADQVWLMNRTNLREVVPIESRPGKDWTIGAISDFDLDDHDDIVWHNGATGANEIWFGEGTDHLGTWALPNSGSAGLYGRGDFNGDEKPDLFLHNRTTGENQIWIMNNGARLTVNSGDAPAAATPRTLNVTTMKLATTSDPDLVPALVADMNGDGKPDIVWRNNATGENSVWIMNGSQVTETRTIETRSDPGWQIGGGGNSNNPETGGGGEGGGGTIGDTPTSIDVTVDPVAVGKPAVVTATLKSGSTPVADREIVFSLSGTEITRLLTGTDGIATAVVPTTGRAAGTYADAISARFNGDSLYAASSKSANLVIVSETPKVTWNEPAAILYGTPLSATQLNATASVPGAFVYTPPAGTVLDAGYQTLSVKFTPTDASLSPITQSTVVMVNKAPASITWATPEPIPYGTPLSGAQLNATSPIHGTFSYDPEPGAIIGVGTQTLHVTFEPDDANYDVSSASTTIVVEKGVQSILWNDPAPITVLQSLTATQLNAKVLASGTAPAGQVTYTPPAGTSLPAGTHELRVDVAATAEYEAATARVDIVVRSAQSMIQWATPAPIVYGTPLSAAQLNATANVPGTFVYEPAAGTILNGGTTKLFVSFTPSDTRYEPATASVTIQVTQATPVVTWATPAPIVYGKALTLTQLNATASVGGDFIYTPSLGTILNAGTHQLNVLFKPDEAANYKSVPASVTLTVLKAPQTLTWANPAPIVYGTLLSATQLNATVSVSGLTAAGALTYNPPAGTRLQAGNGQTLTVTAAATSNYEQATKSVSLDVLKAKPVLTWATPAPIVYRTPLSGTQLNATANIPGTFTYNPPAGTVLEAGQQPLAAHFTPTDTNNYELADASVTLEVQQATPILTWPTPAGIVYGTALSSTQLNATADVPGVFTYSPAAGTILNAGPAQTLSVQFVPTDTRNFKNASATVKLDVAKAKQTLTWTPVAIVYGTPLGASQLNAQVTVVGPAAAGALVYTPPSGTVLDAGTHTLTVVAQETPNYETATLSVPLEVARKPLSLVVDAKSKLYGGAVPALTGTLTGVVNHDNITPSYSTTATISSPAGTYPINGALVDPANRLFNYAVTITPATLTVLPAPLQISADPKSKQYSDPLPQLTATYTGLVLGETPAVLSGTLVIQTTAVRLSAPGPYPITIGGLSSPNYAIVYVNSTFTVTQEDARVEITSPLLVSASAGKPASITLTATIKDISATTDANGDVDAGDIRKATLTFVDRAANTALCTAHIGLISSSEERVGVATCTFTRNFGAVPASLVVEARVGGYYTRDAAADDTTLSIVAPTVDDLTTGATFTVATSAGTYAPDVDSDVQLTGTLKYNRDGLLPGDLSVKYTSNTHKYEISVVASSLSIVRATSGGKAFIVGTGTLLEGKTVIATAPVILTATDAGDSKNDTFSVALFNAGGGFLAAAGWNGSRVVEQSMHTGNIVVHQGN